MGSAWGTQVSWEWRKHRYKNFDEFLSQGFRPDWTWQATSCQKFDQWPVDQKNWPSFLRRSDLSATCCLEKKTFPAKKFWRQKKVARKFLGRHHVGWFSSEREKNLGQLKIALIASFTRFGPGFYFCCTLAIFYAFLWQQDVTYNPRAVFDNGRNKLVTVT